MRAAPLVVAMPSHELLPHTGEIQIRIEGTSVIELFAEAARALAEILGVAAREPAGPWQPISLDGHDREAMLVAWLDELIAHTEIDHLLFTEVAIDELSDHRLRARIRGTPIAATRTAVKAATFHQLRIEVVGGHARTTITLDV
jgi:SHS2 domain-containing protein